MAISPQRLTIYLYSAHRAVVFAIEQLSCFPLGLTDFKCSTGRDIGHPNFEHVAVPIHPAQVVKTSVYLSTCWVIGSLFYGTVYTRVGHGT